MSATASLLALLLALAPRPVAPAPPAMTAPAPAPAVPAWQPRAGRARPLVAVVGQNGGTELSDYVLPYGILSASGAADVLALALEAGPLELHPSALRMEPQATTADFDRRFPDGADYVVVPAVMKPDDPALVGWVRAQGDKGATVVSICDGALVVARTGLLKGRHATGHWATQSKRERKFPDTQWLKDVRYVADGKAASSAGVTAAIPLSLALVEAMAGRERAAAVARELGVEDWSPRHDSAPFHLGFRMYATGARNLLLSRRQDLALPVGDGVDEAALALTADAYARTYRTRVALASPAPRVRTRHGLVLLPGPARPGGRALPALDGIPAVQALDRALADIRTRYGDATARLVALQLEYPGK